jgi:hypothetical protein
MSKTTTTRFAVTVPGGIRTLFSVVEKQSGELIIPIKGADHVGPDPQIGDVVVENRISIHPSTKSEQYNVIKLTTISARGEVTTAVSLTDAVKLKNGFGVIFSRRCQRFVASDAEHMREDERTYALAEIDPSMFNLMHAVFVGHPDTAFDARHPDIVVNEFGFKMFKLVAMASVYPLPSHHTTEFLHTVTLPPEQAVDQEVLRRFVMTGRSPEVCIMQYRNSVTLLIARFIRHILATEDLDRSTIDMLNGDLARLGDVELGQLTTAPGQPTIHLLTSGQIPVAQSAALHPGFLRAIGKVEKKGG